MSARRRIRSGNRVISTGGTPGSGGSFTIGPEMGAPPGVGVAVSVPEWEFQADQNVGVAMTVPEWEFSAGASVGAAMAVPEWEFSANDNVGVHISGEATFSMVAAPRSGTPDSDSWGDAWTDSSLGQTGVNHGNESPLLLNGSFPIKVAWVAFDLTGFVGLTPVGGSHQFAYTIDNNSLTSVNHQFAAGPSAISGGAARPFTESTITQSNQPAAPTAATRSLSTPVGSSRVTVTLTDAELSLLLGKWVLIRIGQNALQIADWAVVSREGAQADRMSMSFTVRLAA